MEQKRSFLPILLSALAVAAAVLGFLLWGMLSPKGIYEGYYSAINDHRAAIGEHEFIRDLYWSEGEGRLSTCNISGESVDIIGFSSYQIRGNTVTFRQLQFYGEGEGRKLTKESDGSYSLTLPFSLKDGGFVLDHCHYERIDN